MIDALTQLKSALADRYRLAHELGGGGMGTVYLAVDLKHGRQVAIKVMDARLGAAIGADRFLREIEIAARLTHPHIVPLHDSGTTGDQLYYVMPYIQGESLRTRLDQEPKLPLDEALRLTREIASALGHAHHKGLVHRDVKPENVLLADGIALVADFGIARATADHAAEPEAVAQAETVTPLTRGGAMIGTPRYMSPEQVVGGPVDARSDLYGLACMVYEMLAGQPPFTAPTLQGLLRQHLAETPVPVTQLRPDVPRGVALVLARALAKEPVDRYETAARFAEALAGAMSQAASTTGTPAPEAGPGPVAHNLPRQRTHFIGRDRELAECERLLSGTRLLTLTGIGGGGKTRLALKLAEIVRPEFPAGVWFVDLAPLQDAEPLALTVATTLGLREPANQSLPEALAAHFANGRALLVLDNCEHVLGAAADLVEGLLTRTTSLKIVVTSREGLGTSGEQVLSLRSLSVPAAGASDPDAIGKTESVRLFVDRARLADPEFTLDPVVAPAVAEICRRLDGIPLALELAAARVKVLSVEEIRARLDDRFRLLTGGSRTALPRHQTLRSTIGWSYDQVGPVERRLLRLLAVFVGGWTLDAAVHVAGDGADEFDVLDGLTLLVDKSLVLPERPETGAMRYTMLETVRQYALERLDESGDGDAARTRHLLHFTTVVELGSTKMHGPEQSDWRARLAREQENLLAAHAWCDHAEPGAMAGLALAYGQAGFWSSRGLLHLGRRVIEEALARPGAQARTKARLLALIAASQFCSFLGRLPEAEAHAQEGLAIARELGDPERVSQALRLVGLLASGRGDHGAARARLTESLALAREIGHPGRLAHALNALGELERAQGRYEAAEAYSAECVQVQRARGDHESVATELANLAGAALGRGGVAQARASLAESLALSQELGSHRTGQTVLYMFAGLLALSGDAARAARAAGAASAEQERVGFRFEPSDAAVVKPLLARARAAMSPQAYDAAASGGSGLSYDEALAEARAWLTRVD